MTDADLTALKGRPSEARIYRYYSLTDGLHRLVKNL